jgi:predicted thioesterase
MSVTKNIPIGAKATHSITVTHDLTIAAGNERLPAVFATPAMINLMEITAFEAVQPFLPEGWISIGVVVNVRHLAATPVGAPVRITAVVTAVDDRTVTFAVEAYDRVEKIGEGTHVRAPVEVARFLRRVEKKTSDIRDQTSDPDGVFSLKSEV